MIEILILSLVQGVTEFIPISSSSHLILISEYSNFQNKKLEIDVGLHIGSFIAVVTFFRQDIFNFIKNKDLFVKVLFGSLPVIITGFLLVKFNLIENIRNVEVIGWMTLIFGLILYLTDKYKGNKKIKINFTFKNAAVIGLIQILSLIPGVSRSGICITGARFLNFNRYDSAKISFLFSIPTLGAVSIYGLKNITTAESLDFSILIFLSIFLSFIFSYITIKFFLNYIKKFSLNLFVIYRVVLGVFLLSTVYL
tara:strand:+ start:7635 stop:8393 length:759 start_codon:yes stop_codon:yes gene_type:complete